MLDEIDKRYFLMATPAQDVGTISYSDISRSCDICGEGKSYGRKFRLHLYTKETYDNAAIACFNCGYATNLYNYLKDNHPQEFTLYRNEKKSSGFNELKLIALEKNTFDDFEDDSSEQDDYIENDTIDTGLDFSSSANVSIKTEVLKVSEVPEVSGIDIAKNEPILIQPVKGFSPLPQDAIDYINNRGIEVQKDWLYSNKNNKIIFNGSEQTLNEYIIVPLKKGDLWYGFQAIAWKQKKFFVYLVTGNTSFKIENIYFINKEEDVFIMESIYDRLSSGLKNSVAALGSNIHEDRLKELKSPVFCLDNQNIDNKSKEETLKYMMAGYKCFIWPLETPNRIKDFNDLRKEGVPFEKIENMIRKNIYQGISGVIRLKML